MWRFENRWEPLEYTAVKTEPESVCGGRRESKGEGNAQDFCYFFTNKTGPTWLLVHGASSRTLDGW